MKNNELWNKQEKCWVVKCNIATILVGLCLIINMFV